MYGAHLESELRSETSGNFKRLLTSLCTAARDESGRVDPNLAKQDARELLKAGELRVGTDESMFNMILCNRNYQQLRLVSSLFRRHHLQQFVTPEFLFFTDIPRVREHDWSLSGEGNQKGVLR